jgi:hypothetical protein
MQFTFPSALFWLLLALPLAALYLLKVRPRQQIVSSVWWWQQVIPDNLPRRWWRRLRHPLSLLAQLLLLAIMALALSEPYWQERPQPRRIVVILDNSVSMQASDVDPNRLELAKRRMRSLIGQLRGDDEMALLTAGTTVRLVHELTAHQPSLRRALAGIHATDGPERLADALTLAQHLPGNDAAERQLIVVTDPAGQAALEQHLAPDDSPSAIRWFVYGNTADNVGITQYQVRRQNVDPLGLECLVEVTSFSLEPRQCRLTLQLDGQPLDVLPIRLPPRQSVVRVLSYASAAGGLLSATLDIDDALMSDNRAVAWLVPRSPRPVTLVTEGNWYLQQVLTAIPLVDLQVSPTLPAADDPHIVILHGKPLDRWPPGRSMIVQPAPGGSQLPVGDELPEASIGRHDTSSALLTHLQLEDLPARGCRQLQLPAGAQVLAATYSGEPVYAIVPHEQGEVLVLNLDVQEGDFPWRTEFPLLMANAVNWLAGQSAEFQASYATGDVVSLVGSTAAISELAGNAPVHQLGGGGARQIRTPAGERLVAAAGQPITQLGPLHQAGIWTLWPAHGPLDAAASNAEQTEPPTDQSARAPLVRLGCNVVNPHESNLLAPQREGTQLAGLSASGQPWWFYLIATGLLLLAVEWWLYQRRWIS